MAAYPHINKFNCEAWFLDFHEGRLWAAEQELLFAFVQQHPGLAEVLYNYENPAPHAPQLTLHFAEGLKKPLHENATEVTAENLHDMLVADMEGLLSEKQTALVEHYTNLHPEAARARKLYAHTRLQPEPEVQFARRHVLKKSRTVVAINRRWVNGAVAAVLLAAVLVLAPERQDERVLAAGPTLPKQLKSTGRRPATEPQSPPKKQATPPPVIPRKNIVKERPIFIQKNQPDASPLAVVEPVMPAAIQPAPVNEAAVILSEPTIPAPIAVAETGTGSLHGNKNQVMLALNRITGLQLFSRGKDRMKPDWMNIAKATASFLQRKTGRPVSIHSSTGLAALH